MGKSYLSYTMALILQAVENGYRYGFDIMTITGSMWRLARRSMPTHYSGCRHRA